jgi:branched-chain amino acid transport system substrate-binding protein
MRRGARSMTTSALVAGMLLATACGSDDGTVADAADSTVPTVDASTTTEASATTVATDGSSAAPPTTEVSLGPATGEPILIGTLVAEAGGVNLTDNRDGMQAIFDAWNAEGGVNGRPLELVSENAGLDPTGAGSAARKLVEENGVVAMVLPLSPVDCQANGQYYEQQRITVLYGISDECTPLDVTFPNGGSAADGLRIPTHWAVTERQARRIAYVGVDAPTSRAELDAVRAQAEADGAEVVVEEFVPFIGADPTSVVARMQEADVDTVMVSVNPVDLATFLSAAATQGVGPSDITWIASPVVYDERVPPTLGPSADGLMTYTPNRPFEDPAVAPYVDIWRSSDAARPMTGMVVNAWLAADTLRELLDGINGEITRETILSAAQGTDALESDLTTVAIPFASSAPPDIAGYMLQLSGTTFTTVSELITLQ